MVQMHMGPWVIVVLMVEVTVEDIALVVAMVEGMAATEGMVVVEAVVMDGTIHTAGARVRYALVVRGQCLSAV